MASAQWSYVRRRGHVLRRQSDGRFEVLVEQGWIELGPVMSWWFGREARPETPAAVRRLLLRACCRISPDAERIEPTRSARLSMCWVRWCLSPPLSYGAPRFLSAADTTARALESFNQSLSEPEEALPRSREQLVGYARDGWERASDRLKGIESRAATFVQTAGLTTTVVLVNNALLTGNNRINGHSRGVFVGALVAASTLLLVAGMYALFATMRTFGRVAPDHPSRIISRARLLDDEAFRRQTIAALLVAQRRTSIVADWKLARLKRASFAFGLAIVAIAVASSAYVFEVTGANSRSSRVTPAESHASTPSHLARLTSIMESLRPAGVHQGGDQIPLATELSGRVARAWKAELTLAPFVASSV